MKKNYDVVIIGGGASGLTAAITVKRKAPELSVAVFEKKECTGKKLSATGNGRCNLSNIKCESLEQVTDFFGSVGISVRQDETGRIYPYSEDAKSVTEILTACAKGEGAEIFLNSGVREMEADPKGGFLLFVEGKGGPAAALTAGSVHAGQVLIATGGKSYGSMGTTGDGYIMARKMGHKVTKLIPGLTAIEVDEDLKDLKGVRSKAQVTLYSERSERSARSESSDSSAHSDNSECSGGKAVFTEAGEVQFREDSLSGICIMNMSGHIRADEKYTIRINLVPDWERNEIVDMLKKRFAIKNLSAGESLKTLVKEALARRILTEAGVNPDEKNNAPGIDSKTIDKIAENLCGMALHVKGLKGWNEAQITVGGVVMDEIDEKTMESGLIKGLFFSGEVLNYDGPCGGYNLHNAWLTGLRAGKGMAESGSAGKEMASKCTEFTR